MSLSTQHWHDTHTGRSPTGRLRNFAAMNEGKLRSVHTAVMRENNDREAMTRIEQVMKARMLWADGMRVRPEDIPADIWDTLEALAL